MVSAKIAVPVVMILGVLIAAGIYGSALNQGTTSSTTPGGTSQTRSSSSSSAGSAACEAGVCTTLESIIAGAFSTATDKQGDGGTTVTVQGLKVMKILTESDGDWHVYVTDGKEPVFITEIIPRDQAAEGKPPVGQVIDETGTPYCDTVHATEAWHDNTCWEIHPVTAWTLSGSQVTITTTYTAVGLNVSISIAHDPIKAGSVQNITVNVADSDGPIAAEAVHIHVIYASGSTTKDYDCTTVASGSCYYSWTIGSNSNPGTFLVTVTVQGTQYSSSFQVTT